MCTPFFCQRFELFFGTLSLALYTVGVFFCILGFFFRLWRLQLSFTGTPALICWLALCSNVAYSFCVIWSISEFMTDRIKTKADLSSSVHPGVAQMEVSCIVRSMSWVLLGKVTISFRHGWSDQWGFEKMMSEIKNGGSCYFQTWANSWLWSTKQVLNQKMKRFNPPLDRSTVENIHFDHQFWSTLLIDWSN